MTKHRTKRRQRGGGVFDWFTSSSSEPGMYEKTKSMFSSFNPFSSSSEQSIQPPVIDQPQPPVVDQAQPTVVDQQPQYIPTGGKSRRKKMRGGKGGLGLVYYATPVSGIKVAEPAYWIKGGSRKRRHRHTRRKK